MCKITVVHLNYGAGIRFCHYSRGKLILLYSSNRSDTVHKIIYCHFAWAFVYHVVMWSFYLPFVCIHVQMQT